MSIKILIVGTGAIGGFYGALLARQGAEVAVVLRSDFAQVKRHGIRIESTLGQWTFKPAQVLKRAADYDGEPDYILLCVKVLEGIDRAVLLRGAVGPDTTLVLIENGIEIESPIASAYPNNELISGLAFICAGRTAPGVVSHQAYGRLALGTFPAGVSANTRRLCRLFENSGIECNTSEDIVTARWQKCVWNAAFNPLSVLSGGLETRPILDHQEYFVRTLMTEITTVAQALGHQVPDDIVERNIEHTHQMPPYKTSMLLDFEQGRPMETEAILGNAIKAARRAGVRTPHLDSVYALMKLREEQIAREHRRR